MAYKIKKEKKMRIGEWEVSRKKFKALPDWEEKFLMRFPPKTRDFVQRIRYLYGIPERERQKGTLVRFGAGEEKLGVITKSQDKGVWVREVIDTDEEGLLWGKQPFKLGKPFFIERGRFEKHLGEKGGVGVEQLMFQ